MIYNVYAIQDACVGFLTPSFDFNDGSAKRNFAHAMRNSQSLFNSHPQDFSLYRIGAYDSDVGVIDGCTPEKICDGVSVKE